jgi:hypothetical protein
VSFSKYLTYAFVIACYKIIDYTNATFPKYCSFAFVDIKCIYIVCVTVTIDELHQKRTHKKYKPEKHLLKVSIGIGSVWLYSMLI